MCNMNSTSREMHWPKASVTQYDSQLRLTDKGHAIKWLIVCYIVLLGFIIYLMGLVPCCGQDGYQAQVLQHPMDTCRWKIRAFLWK